MSKRNINSDLVNNTFNEFQFYSPKEKQSLAKFIYNSKDGTYLGRTAGSWGKIFVFYSIFYTVLAGMFTVCLQGLFSTLSMTEPKWTMEQSLIGTNPGMGFRPISNDTMHGSVIKFNSNNPKEKQYWINLIDDFLKPYNSNEQRGKHCSFNQSKKSGEVCAVDIEADLKTCSPSNQYGYKNNKPCVLLKLNRIFKWTPDVYNFTELPEDMPESLKNHISSLSDIEREKVWVSCNGVHAKDREIMGPIDLFPSPGFPNYYYPYLNQDKYLSPLIAVQFQKLPAGQLINVECRAWAKNIFYNGGISDRKGSVSFQLLMD